MSENMKNKTFLTLKAALALLCAYISVMSQSDYFKSKQIRGSCVPNNLN